MAKFFITTPLYYVNDVPHIGHAYTTIAADALARYHRMCGDEVHFLMGTDENAQKNVESALKKYNVIASEAGSHAEGRSSPEANAPREHASGGQSHAEGVGSPRPFGARDNESVRGVVQQYVDEMSAKWQETWDELAISNDDFIRTTEERHSKYVQGFWQKVFERGDIYKGVYEGLYCTGCEAYKTEAELVEGLCPDHKRAPQKLSEENYFFRLSKYREALIEHIETHPEFVQPEARRNEIIAYIKDHANDFSISRKNLEWGITVPDDPTQTIYVWFDALINYASANPDWWPADLHLVGKDIIKFHCAYWPAMLMSAGLPLPESVFAHGFFTVDGQKMSKTVGNVVDPVSIVQKYGNDVLRYYLLREIPFGADGDFSEARLKERYNGELANGLGNLTARILTMIKRYANGEIPTISHPERSEGSLANASSADKLRDSSPPKVDQNDKRWPQYETHMQSLALDRALDVIWAYISELDGVIDREQPWQMAKNDKDHLPKVLYVLGESLRQVGRMVAPFMPDTAQAIFDQLGLGKRELARGWEEAKQWGGLKPGTKTKRGDALFPRLS